ncbi:MAG: hypothetical protein E6K81_07675 [Candidatus Eisenbacteria bacterium]|uniref:Uncharacterized protein n=1 Tax=Eiseniibacteriota bacterium TaxID=2212470 RepID=A0A538U8Y5_UNCEI|nr:MAG: hypothetical protein E6K81_07675 [Candidatus Eisenbacteria bacterium]
MGWALARASVLALIGVGVLGFGPAVARAAAAAPAAAPKTHPVSVADPACGVSLFVQQAGRVAYRLPHAFLRPGTDSVWTRAAAWRRGVDYGVDLAHGELRLLREPKPGDSLWVSACWLMVPPPLEFQLYTWQPAPESAKDSTARVAPVSPGPGTRPVTGRVPQLAAAGTDLTLSGNKSLAVDFGSSQDAFLRQSLDLAVTGTLAPGVELTGALSDRNTPLSAAGATQDLQSLDRVLIELKAPNGSAALGDVTLDLERGEFGRLERRLQGARGDWSGHGFSGVLAAASAQGEFHRLQFFGVEGRQGPYLLTDDAGSPFISVVAASEVVTLDGERLTRGESADYFMDYERGRITFTNHRPISSASRVTVDYQFTVNRFRRNLAAAGASWERGPGRFSTTFITEGDDRGRPLGITLDASDRFTLAAAGDSTSRAVGEGAVAGLGDYVLIPASVVPAHYAFAGVDSGTYSVRFARVGPGLGAYQDSAAVQERTVFAFVGQGNGAYRVGRPLPLPDSHQLWSVTAGASAGPLTVDVEGAVSRHDLNTYSPLDDGDDAGTAGRARLALAGAVPGRLGGPGGLELTARSVGRTFDPFARLERPFAQEDWGLPVDADLERQSRYELSGFLHPRLGGELLGAVGYLATPDGFHSLRRSAAWSREGRVTTRASWARAAGERPDVRYQGGGRDLRRAELGLSLAWLEPSLKGEWDERRAPSDTGRAGVRTRELSAELRAPRRLAWHAQLGFTVRREARDASGGFVAQDLARTWRGLLETPTAAPWGVSVAWYRRLLEPRADPRRSRSDLASVRLRGGDLKRGWSGLANLEVTNEGENQQVRQLVFVGPGKGAYDAFGNLVGNGDHDLVIVVSPDLVRVARVATSARASWQFGASEVWRGSRLEADFESEARRRGGLSLSDAWLSPSAAMSDLGLSRGAVTQRLESELAPGSTVAALRLRLERRVSGDRSYANFGQTLDDRALTVRWRARPAASLSGEVEARWKRDEAGQALLSGAPFRRVLRETGATAQLVVTPGARLRAVASLDGGWSRAEAGSTGATGTGTTRTVRVGPDLDATLGRGHVGLTVRRAFVSGPPALALIPSTDPAGAPRWEGSARGDLRLHETTTASISVTVRDRTGQVTPPTRPTEVTGRAELRTFF